MSTDFERTYKITQLIEKLNGILSEHGDLPVVARDADTAWRMEIGVMFSGPDTAEDYPARVEIRTNYYDRPKGCSRAERWQ